MNLRQRGNIGENMARRFYENSGYRLIDANVFEKRHGEIDLIMSKNEVYYFIEVKYRRDSSHGYPEESMTQNKIMHFFRACESYVQRNGITGECAYLVCSILHNSQDDQDPDIQSFELRWMI